MENVGLAHKKKILDPPLVSTVKPVNLELNKKLKMYNILIFNMRKQYIVCCSFIAKKIIHTYTQVITHPI